MLVVDGTFWKNRQVFLTGHTGFKGSWLTILLASMGARVSGYALAPTDLSFFESGSIADLLANHTIGDISDFDLLRASLVAAKPEIVIHMAAFPLVSASYAHPIETFQSNVMGTVHLLEAVRQTGTVRVCLNVTTDKVYENPDRQESFVETDRLGGHDPYSASKACSELVSAAYRLAYFQKLNSQTCLTARAGNVIGGGDWAEARIIPDAMRALIAGVPLMIRNPDAIRPWQHVLEPLCGYLTFCEHGFRDPSVPPSINFGPDRADVVSVESLLRLLQKHLTAHKMKQLLITMEQSNLHEANYLKLDISLAGKALGWRPRWHLDTALEKTAEWYSDFFAGKNTRATAEAQIREYMEAQ